MQRYGLSNILYEQKSVSKHTESYHDYFMYYNVRVWAPFYPPEGGRVEGEGWRVKGEGWIKQCTMHNEVYIKKEDMPIARHILLFF